MALTNFTNGLSSFGMPVIPGLGPATGQVFWVGSAVGEDSPGQGTDPNNPFATINYASSRCVAGRGDRIIVKEGHVEAVSAAAGLRLNTAGVHVVGLGQGRNRPIITLGTATTADIEIDAANVTFENLIIDATGFDAIAAAIDVDASDFTMIGCEVILASATAQATLGILTVAGVDRLTLIGNRFVGTRDAGTATAVRIVGGDGHRIEGNVFIGDYTTSLGAIDNATTACTNCTVIGNSISNLTASSTKAMVFVATSTGVIANNRMQILSGTAPITGAAMSWVGANYYAAVIATAGTLI